MWKCFKCEELNWDSSDWCHKCDPEEYATEAREQAALREAEKLKDLPPDPPKVVSPRLTQVSRTDIELIENSLNVKLPADYVELLLSHSGFPGEGERHFSLDAAYILEQNQLLRKEGYYGRPWPEGCFWIGSGWGGEVFAIRLGAGGSAVYMCDWLKDDLPPLEPVNDSVGAFVEDLDNYPDD